MMEHLPGFWDKRNWSDAAWAEYQKRRREHGLRNRVEQALHRLLGHFMSMESWKRREAAQWPSSSGSYDPCEDHFNFLLGAGRKREAVTLRWRAQALRPGFLT